MKVLITSDSHLYNEYLIQLNSRFKDKFDLYIHCGDSSLLPDNILLNNYLCVKGNHDNYDFPNYIVHKNILITHGHLYNVYENYDELIQLCKANDCNICFHGHTHIPTYQIHENIHFVNPGSLMMNRGYYGYGTFAIAEINEDEFDVHFYHHETFEQCDNVISEGFITLNEIKELIKISK